MIADRSIDVQVGVAANFTFVRVVACCLTECNASTCGGCRCRLGAGGLEEAPGRVGGRTDGGSSRRAHDDLPCGVALFQVGDCCGDFGERIAPADVGAHFAGRNQVRKEV
jgi:hypothetical protein